MITKGLLHDKKIQLDQVPEYVSIFALSLKYRNLNYIFFLVIVDVHLGAADGMVL